LECPAESGLCQFLAREGRLAADGSGSSAVYALAVNLGRQPRYADIVVRYPVGVALPQ